MQFQSGFTVAWTWFRQTLFEYILKYKCSGKTFAMHLFRSFCALFQLRYNLYVLLLLLLAYLLNQLDRYTLAVVTKPLAQEIHYGDKGCLKSLNVSSAVVNVDCLKSSEQRCSNVSDDNESDHPYKWDYTGQGFDYQILAGPIFIFIHTVAGIPIGLLAESYNRKTLLGLSVLFWSICTVLSGFVKNYWELAILRFGVGIGQAGCVPFSTSLIFDYFPAHQRGSAFGVYNWGIYTGYSLAFGLGNFLSQTNFYGLAGWRWTFIIAGAPGLVLGLLIMLTLREPSRVKEKSEAEIPSGSWIKKWSKVWLAFLKPSVVFLCLAGSIRNAGGYVWAYNSQAYFEEIGQTPAEIGSYMTVIPMVFGSIGVLLGGIISDCFVNTAKPTGRLWVLIVSQMLATPFAAGVLLLTPPWAYLSLIPLYLLGEMWVGVALAVLVELLPQAKTGSIAAYFFIISNIGGSMPLLVDILNSFFEHLDVAPNEAFKYTLVCLVPGEYLLGALCFMLTLLVFKRGIPKDIGEHTL